MCAIGNVARQISGKDSGNPEVLADESNFVVYHGGLVFLRALI